MDSSSKGDDVWSITASDPELDTHLLGIEGYSKLSDDNLNTILRSFTESLEQKKSHLNLLEKVQCDNKSELIDQTTESLETLGHDIRCISQELTNRRSSKDSRGDDFPFPLIQEQENDSLDLKIVTELVGPSFDDGDKLKFLEQYLSVVHYSRSHPLSNRQLQQIFHLKLKGKALIFFSSLSPALPLKEKIRKLLTVFAYRQHGTDRLVELEEFCRQKHERLDSVYLRLTSILDASSSLVRPSLRQARNEYFLCQAMFSLSLPGVRARLTKYQAERTGDGLYVTSSDLLRMASKYEENVLNGRSEEIKLGLKDPFVTVGELPGNTRKTKHSYNNSETGRSPLGKGENDHSEETPVPNLWEPEGPMYESRERSDMRKSIAALNRKIDELSEAYSKKLHMNRSHGEVQVNSVIPEVSELPPNQSPAMEECWNKMIRPFLEAQWNFYSSYDYGKGPRPAAGTPGVQYERWGSRYRRDEGARQGNWMANGNRPSSEPRHWYNKTGLTDNFRNRFQDSRAGNFRVGQPKKRVRFSEWLQADKGRNPEGEARRDRDILHRGNHQSQGEIGTPSSNGQPAGGGASLSQRIGKGGLKRLEPGDPKSNQEGGKGEVERLPPIAGVNLNQNMFQDLTGPPATPDN